MADKPLKLSGKFARHDEVAEPVYLVAYSTEVTRNNRKHSFWCGEFWGPLDEAKHYSEAEVRELRKSMAGSWEFLTPDEATKKLATVIH